MSKVNYLSTNFTGGELSPRLDGRVDVSKFKNGARILENFIVMPHGGARKRSGSKMVVELKSASDPVVYRRFIYNTEQAYLLIFGPSYVWFVRDGGIITHDAQSITGITQASPAVVTYSGSDTYANGDRVIIRSVAGMTEVNNRQFVVANVNTGANTFELQGVDSSSYGAYSSGGTVAEIVELTTTYTADELVDLRFTQTNDVLYIAHGSHPTRKITRSSHTSWTLSTPSLTTGPFRSINADRTNYLTPSSFSGSATAYGTHIVGETFTLTATNSGTFNADMVGGLFRLWEDGQGSGVPGPALGNTSMTVTPGNMYTNAGKVYGIAAKSGGLGTWAGVNRVPEHDYGRVRVFTSFSTPSVPEWFDSDFLHPLYCVVRVTAYSSSTVVTCEIVRYQMPKNVVDLGTTAWEEGAWSDYRGYPKTCAFYEQRLFFGGSDSEPTALWGSKSAAFEDHTDGTNDSDAIIYRIAAGQADVIRWLEAGRVLTAGTSAGEFAVAASNQNEALTPSNFKVTPQTSFGTSDAPPLRINQAVLYPQRGGRASNASRKLREFSYAFDQDAFNSVDVSVFAEHIFGGRDVGYDRLAYQLEPDSLIFARRTDGVLASCTYERTQEVVAWHRQVLGGDGEVKMLETIPGEAGDELWLAVERTISGGAVRYVEVLQPGFLDDDDKEDAFFVDCGLTYSGSSSSMITGLWHLRGEAVKVLNNGAVETGTVSATGTLTLANATTKAHIGLAYTAVLESEDFEAGAQAGTAQGRAKRISNVTVRLLNSLGGTMGPDETTQKAILYRTPADPHGTSPPLFSGLMRMAFPSGWDREARVRLEHDEPLPFHVTGIVAEINVSG